MNKNSLIGFAVFVLSFLSFNLAYSQKTTQASQNQEVEIKWHSWEEGMAKAQATNKKIILSVFTSDCVWCKKMDNVTFKQEHISSYINENYIPIKFDAETKDEVTFKEKKYNQQIKSGSKTYHALAAELLKGRLSFPALVFLDENLEVIQSIAGFKTPHQFEKIATYFANDSYKKTPWSSYQRNYKSILVGNK